MRATAEANRRRILSAAQEVFGAQGATGSTEDVAARAGVGIATVFRHFPTKSDLVVAALVDHLVALSDLAEELAEKSDVGLAVHRLVRTMIESGSTKLTLASALPDGTLPPEVRTASKRLRDAVGVLLSRAKAERAVRPEVTIDEVYLLVRGLAHASTTGTVSPRTLRGAVDVVLAGLRT